MRYLLAAVILTTTLLTAEAVAGTADVVAVESRCNSQRECDFSVTVKHNDQGWDHYADRWEVQTLNGESLGIRVLQHPHVNEQPFTRFLNRVAIPEGIHQVIIRARDSQHGYGGDTMTVDLDFTAD